MKAAHCRHIPGLLSLIALLALPGAAEAATLILGASSQSRYSQDGTDFAAFFPSEPIGNTFTGFQDELEYRAYFVFDVSTISSPIASGKLKLMNKRYYSSANSEAIALYDVNTPVASLVGGVQQPEIFDDLGEGTVYGNATVFATPPQNDFDNVVEEFFEVTLTSAAIQDINQAAAQGDDFFALGVRLVETGEPSPYVFTTPIVAGRTTEGIIFSGGPYDPIQDSETLGELILETAPPPPTDVPEPAGVMSILALGSAGAIAQRLAKRQPPR
ncbi:MAG: hypothetical protein ACFBSG_01980 [Leptolyngbyaceae cyanobacterium]